MFVDSHCHHNYLDEPDLALVRARQRGVSASMCIGVERAQIRQVLDFAARQPDVWASVGEHPGSCSGDAGWVDEFLDHPKVVAVGEMGLDYHYQKDEVHRERQRDTFRQQMEIARRSCLPVIIHTRAAERHTREILRDFSGVRGVMHCFTESVELAEAAMDLGYYISISGIVTFNNAANVREVARAVPLSRLLIETDAPWLAPVPHRGRQNEPSFVVDTAGFLAELLEIEIEQLARATSENFYELFSRAVPPAAG